MDPRDTDRMNLLAVRLLARFLNRRADAITSQMMEEMQSFGLDAREAYAHLLAALCGLDAGGEDRELFQEFFLPMVCPLDWEEYARDPYYLSIRVPELQAGRWALKRLSYKPFQAFVAGDPRRMRDGRVLPRIGFFDREFPYPAVLEDGREWMTVTPNEVDTMRAPVRAARGRVLTYGLGLGYFAFMASRKEEVTSVTVVERDGEVIGLFREHLLPQFPCGYKIRLLQDDAFHFAESRMGSGGYDLVFTDLWHDPSDGVALYQRMKKLERFSPGSEFYYWIEETLRDYAD